MATEVTKDEIQSQLNEALEQTGLVLVPKHPTREMCNAFEIASHKAWIEGDTLDDALPAFEAGWKAMLAELEKSPTV